jgi:LPXTG-motif cell wall-anchored protein
MPGLDASLNLAFALVLANLPDPSDCPGGDCDYSEGSDLWILVAGAIVLAAIVLIGLFLWRRRRRDR